MRESRKSNGMGGQEARGSARGDAMQRERGEEGMGQDRDEVIEIHQRAGET